MTSILVLPAVNSDVFTVGLSGRIIVKLFKLLVCLLDQQMLLKLVKHPGYAVDETA